MSQILLELPGAVAQSNGSSTSSLPETLVNDRRSCKVRRLTQRVLCDARVQLHVAEYSLMGRCGDISLGGMLFFGPVLSLGERVGLTMELPQLGQIRVIGEVIAHRDHPTGTGMAIRFPRLSQSDLGILTRFVAAQAS